MGKRDKRKAKDKGTKQGAKNKDKEEQKKKKKHQKNAKAMIGEPFEDIDAILAEFQKEQEELYKVTEETNVDPPSRRCNASFVANPTNPNELILFGGEYFDGQRVQLFNDYFRYNIEKKEWKRITSPNSPGPRCSHQVAITPSGILYLFGGEFASPNESTFFHYKDFWMLDLKSNKWDRLEMRIKPSPRSGHRMVLWKQYLVLFGGFYDTNIETKYFDDLWIFNLANHQVWKKLEMAEPKPTARSGFQFISHPTGDTIILYGGYTKQYTKGKKTKGIIHADTWALKMSLDEKQIKWERRKKGGLGPSARSGCTMVGYKNKAVMFGGVTDIEEGDENLESICHNDVFIYTLDNNKWFPLTLRPPKEKGKKKPKVQQKEQKTESQSDSDLEIDSEGENENEDDNSETKAITPPIKSESEKIKTLNVNQPCPRFNAMMTVQRNILYIFGGILESGNREFTLNDLWSLNLDKAHEFECLKPDDLSQVEWLDENSDKDSDCLSDDEDEDSEESEDDGREDSDENGNIKDQESEISVQSKQMSEVDIDQDEEEYNENVAVKIEEIPADQEPQVNEALKDYFVRTGTFWQRKTLEELDTIQHGKSLRRDAFQICQDHWTKHQPRLAELAKMIENDEAGDITSRKAQGGSAGVPRNRG